MPALDFILPTANLVSPGNGTTARSPAGEEPNREPFDQVMSRALSPPPADPSPRPDPLDVAPTGPGEGKPDPISPPLQRRRVQARTAATEKAAPAAVKPGETSAQSPDTTSHPQISEGDAGKGRGDNATGSPSGTEAQVVPGSLPAFMVQLVPALPIGVLSLFAPAAENKNILDPGAMPATASASLAAVAGGPDVIGALTARPGTKTSPPSAGMTSNPGVLPDKAAAELIARLKPDGRQANGIKTDELAAANTNPSDSQTVPLPESVPEPAIHPPQNEVSFPTDLNGKSITFAPSESHGISAAKLYLPMNKKDKTNEIAGSNGKIEKVLPGDADSTGSENNLPPADPLARISPRSGPAMVVQGSPGAGTEPAATVATGVSAASAVDLRSRALERTHDMVALQAVRLVDSKSDSLRVVIKPGAGMELSLEMRQHGNAIDAQVIVHRGDFGHLSQHWPELQQRLEQRGIRLAPLTGSENSTTDSQANGFHQPQREFTGPDSLSAGAFAEFALASSSGPSPTPSTLMVNAQRGWETWA